MRVKRNEIVDLMELLEYAQYNNIENTTVYTHGKDKLMVEVNGEGFKLFDSSSLRFDDKFTLEVNLELTPRTDLSSFGRFVVVHDDEGVIKCDYANSSNIKSVLSFHSNFNKKSIYLLTNEGKMILVWDVDRGIPEDGVITGGIV